jgi:hypothetical protein
MAFNINTVCSKCGRKPPEVISFHLRSMTESVCFICEPPPLEGPCPCCEGHGQVDLFNAWSTLNQVISDGRSRFDVLREELPKCRTKSEAKALLSRELFSKRYPFLPDWLPD